jgi:glycosyltransferase involved in cell wall biosynthesis
MASLPRLKILLLTNGYPRRAGDNYGIFVGLAMEELAKRGHQVHVLAPHDPGLPRWETQGNLTIERFPYFYPTSRQRLCYRGGMISTLRQGLLPKIQLFTFLLAEYRALLRALRREKFDLLHYHWAFPQGLVVRMAKARKRLPVVATYHGGDVSVFTKGWGARLLRRVASSADLIITVSRATRGALLSVAPELEARVRIIPSPIDGERFRAGDSLPPPPGFPEQRPVLLCVGRLAREKGFEYAIEAMRRVRQSYPKACLVIVGRGPEENKLKALAETLLGPGVCHFPGFVAAEQLPAYYGQANVFLLPSIHDTTGWQEGLGLVIAEAALAGCPAVVTRVGGTEDVVQEGETGLLVPQQDPEALAEAALKIISSPELREKLSVQGRVFSWETFSAPRVVDRCEQVYGELLAARGADREGRS